MIAICKRELASLFQNVIGWLFVAATMALYGLYFFLYNLVYGAPSITYTLSGSTFIFLVTVPILTMRILAEERRNKTDQLILTAPVSVWEIVCGKFLALAAAFGICVFLMGLTPLLLSAFGKVALTESYVALIGFFLYGLTCLSIGMFVSSLTESQVISAVVSFVFLFIGFMMASIVDSVFSGTGIAAKILGAYDLTTPLEDLETGSLNFVSIIYYISMIALFLFLTVQSIEKRRWTVSAKKLSANVFSVSTIVIAIAAMIALNVVMAQLPEKYTVKDVTPQKLYSVSKKTTNYLKGLKDDVRIYVVGTKKSLKNSYEELPKTLEKYDEASPHIKVTYVNPEKNPTFGNAYGNAQLETGTIVVESDKRYKTISPYDIYQYDMDYESYSQKLVAYDAEGKLTSAIAFVLTDDVPVVYTLTGHDETVMGPTFTDAMAKANLDVRELNFLQSDGVPGDAAFLLIGAPQSDFSQDDVDKVLAYVEGGGQIFVTLDFASIGKLETFKQILNAFKITPVEGVIAEMDKSYYYQNNFYLLPEVEASEATGSLAGSTMIFSPFAVGLDYTPDDNSDDEYTKLLVTSESAVSKKEYASKEAMGEQGVNAEIKKEDGDPEGPFTIGLQVHKTGGGENFFFGSAYQFTDAADKIVSYRNSALFTEILNVMAPQKEAAGAIVIPAKKYDMDNLTINTRVTTIYGLLFVVVLPIACIAAGVVIWWKRRRR